MIAAPDTLADTVGRIPFDLRPEHEERRRLIFERNRACLFSPGQAFLKAAFGSGPYNKLEPPKNGRSATAVLPKPDSGMTLEEIFQCVPEFNNQPMENTMNSDVYTRPELAAILGASTAALAQWQIYGQIPAEAVAPDKCYYKSVMDPIIEAGTLQRLASMSATERLAERGKARRKAAREAKEAAGESVRGRPGKAAKSAPCKPVKCQPKKPAVAPVKAAQPTAIDPCCDPIIRDFWKQDDRAVGVMSLPPTIIPTVVEYVNEAIRFCHSR